MKKLILAAAAILMMACQTQAETSISLSPGEVLMVTAIPDIDGFTGTMMFTGSTTMTGTAKTVAKKPCTKEQLHKLLYQARQHLPKKQDYEELTVVAWMAGEKKSDKLRRAADDLDVYDRWYDEIDRAIDKDECD